jgi:hypothetical protein
MRLILTLLFGLLCLAAGLCVGVLFAPQLKTTAPAQQVMSVASKIPWAKSISQTDNDSPFELYNYPVIKFKAKPLAEAPGGIIQLWTTYDRDAKSVQYRLTVFKGGNQQQYEVQLLDGLGFKLGQFNAGDFHAVPGASDIVESRESYPVSEEKYRQIHDYSVK